MSDSANIDIRHLAHSLLAKAERPKSAPAAAHIPRLNLPKHIVEHAHSYLSKVMKAKGFQ